jgi:predicted MFS family arabinose efflux permease
MDTTTATTKNKFTNYQVLVILLLVFTQFTVVLDFMVMSPLGDMLMKSMSLTTSQFGFAVSAYAFSAGYFRVVNSRFCGQVSTGKNYYYSFMSDLF